MLCGIDIDMHDYMQMVAHNGIAVDTDGKAGGNFMQPLCDPGLTMAVIDRRVGIDAAQPRTPDTA